MARRPTATYRLQFTPDFGFQAARELIPYLDGLGISHVYASPLVKPRHGSQHGYDVVDPTSLNPELGEEHEFDALVQELAGRGMGVILDIVPNHMAATPHNLWWNDVLENGRASRYADFFDIDWAPREPGQNPQIVLPTLGDHFAHALQNGELRLGIDEHGFAVWYYEHRFPVDPSTYELVLGDARAYLVGAYGDDAAGREELDRLIDESRSLTPPLTEESPDREHRLALLPTLRTTTWRLYHSGSKMQEAFDATIKRYNGETEDAAPYERLEHLLLRQPYRLAFWRRANEQINYRRFFDIADLVSLRTEQPDVFDAVHSLILELAGTEGIDGFRADHVDGLFDPKGYAERLRERLNDISGGSGEHLLLVEKILTDDERLPLDWPVDGTTGYEFAHRLNALLADPDGLEKIESHYRDITGNAGGFQDTVHASKAYVLDDLFYGEFQRSVDRLFRIVRSDRRGRDISRRQLETALLALLVYFPVYRTYTRDLNIADRDRAIIDETLQTIRGVTQGIEEPVWDVLLSVLHLDGTAPESPARLAWIQRLQQLTGPLMAKGLEDTALYVYTPLLSLNEVGGEPETITVDQFHEYNQHIAAHWPHTMLTTSTHDTKRSEDVRARLGVLSELSDEWTEHLDRWREHNALLKAEINGAAVPDTNEEQFIYQTLLGSWPLDPSEFPAFRDRVKEYMTKAMREAKVHSTWLNIDEEYEAAVLGFIDRILGQDPASPFMREFTAFQTRISSYGAWNSLSQLVLKLTSPGFPDIYQGMEMWDFSMADPDNRRPVDFERRVSFLRELERDESLDIMPLLQQWRDGRVKMLISARLLRARREHPEPFQTGTYLPLAVQGQASDNVIAFARRTGDQWSLTVVPRHTTRLVPPETPPVGEDVWGDTAVTLPDGAPSSWTNPITRKTIEVQAGSNSLRLADLLAHLPAAVLRNAERRDY